MLRKLLTTIVNSILATSFFTMLCSLSLCLSAERLLVGSRPMPFSALHLIIAGSTLLEYNVHRLMNRHATYPFNKIWIGIMGGIGLVMCVFALSGLTVNIIIWLMILGLLSFTYSLPVLPFPTKKRWKDYGVLKIIVLTIVWVISTTVLPMIWWHVSFRTFWPELVLRFLLIFPLCLAFDIRDVHYDAKNNIRTLPARIGVSRSYLVIDLFLAAFVLFGLVQYFFSMDIQHLAAVIITAVAAKMAIQYSKSNAHTNVYIGLIDGAMLLYGILLLI